MKEKLVTKTIGSLSLHPDIIEIRPVNLVFVSRYRQAMREGDQFPLMVIDQQGRIVSGAHRYTAYRDEMGEEFKVQCIKRTYKTEADLLEDAVKDNAKHGNPLDGISRKRAMIKLVELGRSPDDVAKLLGVAVKRIETWGKETVLVVGNAGKTQAKPIKRGLLHMAGTSVAEREYEAHIDADRGLKAVELARQLIRHLQNGWIDIKDEKTAETLIKLRGELTNAGF